MRVSPECPSCYCPTTRVTNTVPTSFKVTWRGEERTKTVVRRHRRCHHCGYSFVTVETHEDDRIGKPQDSSNGKRVPPPSQIKSNPYLP
jgi:transcriptional regulator NrdR family protein